MTELENIILTIDTREQNQVRIKAVEDWFTGHNAVVEHSALQHCDYRLIGEFRGISINIGVEAKGWDNFLSDDIAEMEEKLLLATGVYDHVGFFVETQNYTFVPDENNKHGKLNYSIPRLNKNLPAKTLAAFEGFLDTISKHPQIHVRQLRSEAQFPYSLYDLLVYLQKPHILTVKSGGYVPSFQNLLMQIPQIGVERAKILIQHYPNLFWLCSAFEESLISIMGKSIGTIIFQYLHNTELQTLEWMAGHHLDGTVKYKTICGQSCYNPQYCDTSCERHPYFSHAEETIFNNHNSPLSSADTSKSSSIEQATNMEKLEKQKLGTHDTISSHPSACGIIPVHKDAHVVEGDTSSHPSSIFKDLLPTPKKLDDPQSLPPSVVKQEVLIYPPAEINIGLDDKPLEYVVKCRACHQTIDDCNDDETGFCQAPECIAERNKSKQKMNLDMTLKEFMQDMKPHIMQDIVDYCEGWGAPYIFDRVMANVKSGNIKRVTEQDGKVTFQRAT